MNIQEWKMNIEEIAIFGNGLIEGYEPLLLWGAFGRLPFLHSKNKRIYLTSFGVCKGLRKDCL